jgi:glycosyltransferase involved in cell wall biosynthesis
MNITFLTFYYPPDLSAGSFRAAALVEALSARLREEDRITVITTSPNRYREASVDAPETELHGPVTIRRIRLPRHESGMVDQAKAFAHFARHALKLAGASNPDLVIGTSSRLFTASLASTVAMRHRAKLYLDIRDIFSDTIGDVFGAGPGRFAMPLISALERFTIRRADAVNLVSPGFLGIFEAMAPGKYFRTFTNGIDPEWLAPLPPSDTPPAGPINIVFAGNIGEGQGLHKILPVAAKQLENEARFTIVGAGGRRGHLETALRDAGVVNVELVDPVPRSQLADYYIAADQLFLHLNDYPAFEKVIPSKVFEYAATGKPILAGIAGYGAQFISENIDGAAVFRPCDAAAMVDCVRRSIGEPASYDRGAFVQRFDRGAIMKEMAADILSFRG